MRLPAHPTPGLRWGEGWRTLELHPPPGSRHHQGT